MLVECTNYSYFFLSAPIPFNKTDPIIALQLFETIFMHAYGQNQWSQMGIQEEGGAGLYLQEGGEGERSIEGKKEFHVIL